MLNKIVRYFLENKLVTVLLLGGLIAWGIVTAPFGWQVGWLPSDPVPVDAIPDIGDNQQIVFTSWPGRSPQDIEDQVSYPLTTYLLGVPGVKTVRSSSIFGFSSIYIIFNEEVEFYWSRSRVLEKLNALPAGLLPEGVQPALGPDATALGQVFWYTLEGRDTSGNPTGGWDPQEMRTAQDYLVKYGLNAVEGVSEVASIGGFVKEYQVDVNPAALQGYDIPLTAVLEAVRRSNKDVGAKTVEINQAEYLVRGLGYIREVADLEEAVVTVKDNVPIRIRDVAHVSLGPATRRGALDKGGAEAVGGVVVARYGANPMEVINLVKAKIKEMSPGLPKKILNNGTVSQLTLVPFYDRSQLIQETLGTLEEALSLEILITILVVIVMVVNLRASLLIASLLPMAVLMVFIAMRYFGVEANIVALSGIAIAIGTMVDLGIILSENMLKQIDEAPEDQPLIETVYKGAAEVSSAILTAVSTTIVSFIPVFTMQGAEGKLFGPLAFTKSFALLAALLVALLILPTLAHWFFGLKTHDKRVRHALNGLLVLVGLWAMIRHQWVEGFLLIAFGGIGWSEGPLKSQVQGKLLTFLLRHARLITVLLGVTWLLAGYWLPLGAARSLTLNFLFVALLIGLCLGGFLFLEWKYTPILNWCLAHKKRFLTFPMFMVLLGLLIWQGTDTLFGSVARGLSQLGWEVRSTQIWTRMTDAFPGVGEEFMPSLNEGSFLLMPTSMPHSGMAYNRKVIADLDQLLGSIPEIESVVGKMGRVESALDPAPISMYENIINYKPEYLLNEKGYPIRFQVDKNDYFITVIGDTLSQEEALAHGVTASELIPDPDGRYFRNWRPHIHSPDAIWNEIVSVTKIPGVTSAPKLQPIETRLIMLQTGMRAPMGIKVYGPDLKTIQDFGLRLEALLKQVTSVKADAVFADRIVGKPYLQLEINRNAIARYGLHVDEVQQVIEMAIGGMPLTTTVEGRERYPVRVRYPRELRADPEAIGRVLVPTPIGVHISLRELVTIAYERGPQVIKSEDSFLVGYVLFDKQDEVSEVTAVEDAQAFIRQQIDAGKLKVPDGVSYRFSGNYENQIRAQKRLAIIVPLVLGLVFLILYFQFRSIGTSLMVFSGIAMAFSGAFFMLWLYGQSWFLDFSFFGTSLRDLFQIHTIHLSVAVWVGFIALFGIATDDGVLMATYLDQSFARRSPGTLEELRNAVVVAGQRRIKPAVMTSATTIIALLPVLTASGRGADIMIPMAIPAFGGMTVAAITYFIVPVLYCWREERRLNKQQS